MANNLNTTNPPASTVPASGAAVFSPETPPSSQRELLERAIENLIAFLDVIDPDPDLEDGGDAEPDEDGEPSLASTASINQQHWALSSCWRKLAALFRWGRRAASRLLVRRLEIAGTGFDARDEKFRTALGQCIRDIIGSDRAKELPDYRIGLFQREFIRDQSISEIANIISPFESWNEELKSRRDPAAHRIPLSIPPSAQDDASIKKYNELQQTWQSTVDEASKAGASGEADSSNALFKEANEIHDRLQTIGGFLPVFHHHPNEGGFDVYPTVPNDVGKLVLVCRGVLPVIERTLYP